MHSLLFILLSISMKIWFEREREKVFPMQLIRYMDEESMKINIRARTSGTD